VQGFLIIVHTLLSVFLVLVVLMQASQGGGLSGTFGSASTNAIFGGRSAATLLSKLTGWLAIGFITLAILISLVSAPGSGETESLLKQQAIEQPVAPVLDLSAPAIQEPLEAN
jgi:preprotein translocase subunit SecG